EQPSPPSLLTRAIFQRAPIPPAACFLRLAASRACRSQEIQTQGAIPARSPSQSLDREHQRYRALRTVRRRIVGRHNLVLIYASLAPLGHGAHLTSGPRGRVVQNWPALARCGLLGERDSTAA